MSPEQTNALYAHVWPIFWPVLWWNLIVYRAWRDELRARGHDSNVCIAVARWGRLVVTYVEPPRPDLPEYQGLSERCAAHIARLSNGLTGAGPTAGDAEPGWFGVFGRGLRRLKPILARLMRWGSASFPGARIEKGSVIYPVPVLDSS